MTSAANPGPGTYENPNVSPKAFNATGQSSVFQSKVPNVKDLKIKNMNPGPGTYTTVVSIEKKATEHLKKNTDGQYIGQEPQSFLSKTQRGEFWKHEGQTPFTRQTFAKVVGPGHYDVEKKKDDLKNRIVQEEAVHVPFSSTDLRDFEKRPKTVGPGPGAYIDINNPLHCSFKSQIQNMNREERHQ